MAEGVGFEIPPGSPGELRAAATAWSALADLLAEHARTLDGAASTVVSADWHGEASAAYAFASTGVGLALGDGAEACNDAARACRRFARILREARQRAKEATRRAEDAITRRDEARRAIADAERRVAAAGDAAEAAARRAGVAGAAGPAAAGALASAEADGREAVRASEAAGEDLRRARERLHDAERDLERARREGEDANEDAERAARAAAQAFGDVAASAGGLAVPMVGLPVPVSLRGSSPDLPALNGGFGGPFHAPGRFASPGDARAAQIARQRQAALDAAEAQKDRKGSVLDGVAGLVNSLSMGTVDVGGDKDSDRYRGGDLAGYIPITVNGVLKIGGRVVGSVAKRKARKEAAEEAREKALRELRQRRAREQAREIRLDQRHGETFAQAMARHRRARREMLDEIELQNLKRKNNTDLADLFSQGLETLAHHRPGGVPAVLSDIAKNWPAHRAGMEQAIRLLSEALRR